MIWVAPKVIHFKNVLYTMWQKKKKRLAKIIALKSNWKKETANRNRKHFFYAYATVIRSKNCSFLVVNRFDHFIPLNFQLNWLYHVRTYVSYWKSNFITFSRFFISTFSKSPSLPSLHVFVDSLEWRNKDDWGHLWY